MVAATPFLWEYYRSESVLDREEGDEWAIAKLDDTADIWEHVRIELPPTICEGGTMLEPARSYISFEGSVDWEQEHGLQLVFEEGLRVCKVGPYDGHVTNAHAFDDPSLLGVVFFNPRAGF
jgi:hypothetical protein